jgi:hypothetical protein
MQGERRKRLKQTELRFRNADSKCRNMDGTPPSITLIVPVHYTYCTIEIEYSEEEKLNERTCKGIGVSFHRRKYQVLGTERAICFTEHQGIQCTLYRERDGLAQIARLGKYCGPTDLKIRKILKSF